MNLADIKLAVVGLGYVGLPLAVEFGRIYRTIGVDLDLSKIENYNNNFDPALEVPEAKFKAAKNLMFTADCAEIANADIVIIAVPTPVNLAKTPDFEPLINASTYVGKYLKKGAIVIYESTVYPGATEEVCIPVLEKYSKLIWKTDFHVGYSPERVNPGDKVRTLTKIVKVVSGDNKSTLRTLSDLYSSIIEAGVHQASSIKVAEASKVIENTQRDLNIALMNELAIVFDRIGIDTLEVLKAAETKWNFLPFKPGLVGGHCIGVDPYYLTYKAEMLGYHPQVILAGRRINDSMPSYIASKTVQLLLKNTTMMAGDSVIIFGITFKENCSDIRNSKVADLVFHLKEFGLNVFVHDPLADPDECRHEYGIELTKWIDLPIEVSGIISAVAHNSYQELNDSHLKKFLRKNGVIIDIKGIHDPIALKSEGYVVWRL